MSLEETYLEAFDATRATQTEAHSIALRAVYNFALEEAAVACGIAIQHVTEPAEGWRISIEGEEDKTFADPRAAFAAMVRELKFEAPQQPRRQ